MKSAFGFVTGSVLAFAIGVGVGLLALTVYVSAMLISTRLFTGFLWWSPPSTNLTVVIIYIAIVLYQILIGVLQLAQDNREVYEMQSDDEALIDLILIRAIMKHDLSVCATLTSIVIIGQVVSALIRHSSFTMSWIVFITTFVLVNWINSTVRVRFFRQLGSQPPTSANAHL